jgi:hypothetical protein
LFFTNPTQAGDMAKNGPETNARKLKGPSYTQARMVYGCFCFLNLCTRLGLGIDVGPKTKTLPV